MNSRESSFLCVACLLGTAVLGTVANAADETQAAFDRIYGPRIKSATATGTTKDDIELATQLLQVARQSTDNAALLTLLCENAATLGSRTKNGYGPAIDALELLAKRVAEERTPARQRILILRRKLFSASRGEEKAEVGARLIDDCMQMADAKLAEADAQGAMGFYRDASSVATAIRSQRVAEIRAAMKAVRSQLVLFSRIKQLKARLKASKNDPAIAEQLVMAYVVDLDDPAEARKYTFLLQDEDLKTRIAVANKPFQSLSLDEARSMGQWYHELASRAKTDLPKSRMLGRARAYYDHFQTHAEKPDSLIKLALSDIDATLKKLHIDGSTATRFTKGAGAGATVDLLKLIDVTKHVEGDAKWTLTKAGLTCPNGPSTRRCRVPVVIQGSYELAVEVTEAGGGHLSVDLPVGDRTVMFFMNYAGHTLFTPIAGAKAYSPANPTRTRQTAASGQKHTYQLTVLIKGDQCQLKVDLDGKQITEWEGPLSQVGSKPAKGSGPPGMTFHKHFGSATFHTAQVRMLSGRITRGR